MNCIHLCNSFAATFANGERPALNKVTFQSLRMALGALALSTVASAALITSVPVGGTTTTFSGGSGIFGPSSTTVDGFFMTSTGNWVHDYSGSFGLVNNGSWSGFGMIGVDTSIGAITIDLGGSFSTVGGFMNYAPGFGTPTISAMAADGTTVLESWDLSVSAPIVTPGGFNEGAFRGIQRGSADIAFFRISDSFIVMHDITIDGGVPGVPEPTTFLLFGGGLAALLLRRRKA